MEPVSASLCACFAQWLNALRATRQVAPLFKCAVLGDGAGGHSSRHCPHVLRVSWGVLAASGWIPRWWAWPAQGRTKKLHWDPHPQPKRAGGRGAPGQLWWDGSEREQHHQCIALRRLINSGSQVLNTLLTQGLSEFVCLSAFLHTADGPRSTFIYIACCLESYKSVADKYATSSKINVKFLLLDWQFANC